MFLVQAVWGEYDYEGSEARLVWQSVCVQGVGCDEALDFCVLLSGQEQPATNWEYVAQASSACIAVVSLVSSCLWHLLQAGWGGYVHEGAEARVMLQSLCVGCSTSVLAFGPGAACNKLGQ
jgi:hypothetical protein